ncbi:MAG: SCO family protein [Acidobacteriota bacterium]
MKASLAVALALASGCGRGAGGATPRASAAAHRYHLTGQVIDVDAAHQLLTIKHARIVGYMEGMTMPFHVPDQGALDAAQRGTKVEATLVVDGDHSWLEEIALVSGEEDSDWAALTAGAQPGDEVPDFVLINQDHQVLSLKQLRGKAVALTFIYVRCPLPDFCPLISTRFAAAERLLQASPALAASTALVSVSFDPAFDTPEVLARYRATFLGESERQTQHWQCATGSVEQIRAITTFFGLQYAPDSGQISHSLRTVIIRPDGRIANVHPVNDWSPERLVAELADAAAASERQ